MDDAVTLYQEVYCSKVLDKYNLIGVRNYTDVILSREASILHIDPPLSDHKHINPPLKHSSHKPTRMLS